MKRTLPPCPSSPNCVSTQATEPDKKMPPLRFEGASDDAVERVVSLLRRTRRVRIAEVDSDYVHAEFTTPLFRFVDDVEFLADENGKRLHFRSASRVGHSDLGTNRRRMQSICRRLVAMGGFLPDDD